MPDTHGFKLVIQAADAVIRKVLRGAWKSAECPDVPGDEGRIPQFRDIPPGTSLDSFVIAAGQVQIPQDQLDAHFIADFGAELKLGLEIQVEIQDPPVPSATLLDMKADVRAKAPIGMLPDSKNVFLLLEGMPRSDVSVVLTSGDPLAPHLDALLSELVHKAYENGAPSAPGTPKIPHSITQTGVPLVLGLTADAYSELYDDLADPAHWIETTRPDPATVRISIPIYLRVFHFQGFGSGFIKDPMGIETRIDISAPFQAAPGSYSILLSAATVTVGTIQPAGAAHGNEGPNYTTNKSTIPGLDGLLTTKLQQTGKDLATAMGDMTVQVPTVQQIETMIGDLFHAELVARKQISVWTPESAEGTGLAVADVAIRVRADALIIAANDLGSGDI
ncbi:MAG TPA: hypothetical protein VHK68_08705, partial [Gemmatimonadales bacterium]|nr:hypothetical protein [Gemmatimonadales bacterium]